MRADRIVLGTAMLLVGLIWLCVNLGFIPAAAVARLWRYWPLLLILWGVLLLFGKGSGSGLGCLLVIVTAAALFFTGIFSFSFLRGTGQTTITNIRHDENIKSLRLDLIQHAGEFYLHGHHEKDLLQLSLQSTIKPEINESRAGDVAEVTIRDPENSLNLNKRFSRWDIAVQENFPLEIKLRTGATNADLDLAHLNVTSLNIKAGAGELAINLGPAVKRISVESGACSIDIKVPHDIGVRLKTSGALISVDSEGGHILSVGDRLYESKDLEKKKAIVAIEIKAAAGSITLHNYQAI